MLKRKNISEELEQAFVEAENKVTKLYREKNVKSEDLITGALISELDSVNEYYESGKFTVRTNIEAFEAGDEPESGADIGIRHQFHGPEFRISRGIIAQAKRYGTRHSNLPFQCYKMTLRTEQSYVFTYSKSDISALPAMPIYLDGGIGNKFTKYYSNPFPDFMCGFVEGFYGEIPVAENIDAPSEIHPVEERARYLVDIKTSVSMEDKLDVPEFDCVDKSNYHRIDPGEYHFEEFQ